MWVRIDHAAVLGFVAMPGYFEKMEYFQNLERLRVRTDQIVDPGMIEMPDCFVTIDCCRN